ncbi:MAG: hypothetical protein AAFX59_08205 [Pseudomonadota bacterium]
MARILHRFAVPLAAFVISASAASAETLRTLYETMRMDELIEIMQLEGVAYGDELGADMLGNSSGAGWPRVVARIYSVERMETEFLTEFERRLEPRHIAPLIAFFGSDQGREITNFEVSARRALLDEDVEATAKQIWQDLEGEIDPRLDIIERFVTVNDLIEANVAGTMNSSLAFYEGLATGDSEALGLTPDRIMSLVWEQETEIRANTREWVYPFLTLAFEPLSDADLEAYIAMSESEAGQALNTALMGAFDVLFVDISRDMGTAAAIYMQGEDI